jgi:hypothetical protein
MVLAKRKCIPLKQPIPPKFQGDIEEHKDSLIPKFSNLVNFPSHTSQSESIGLSDGMRCCVMCEQPCLCSTLAKGRKTKSEKGVLVARQNDIQDQINDIKANGLAIIPTQNKGVCTICDVKVWVVTSSGMEIKWCKGCKNFRPWAAFGEKGHATKCLRCRDRQKEKYASQKEEKDKSAVASKLLSLT